MPRSVSRLTWPAAIVFVVGVLAVSKYATPKSNETAAPTEEDAKARAKARMDEYERSESVRCEKELAELMKNPPRTSMYGPFKMDYEWAGQFMLESRTLYQEGRLTNGAIHELLLKYFSKGGGKFGEAVERWVQAAAYLRDNHDPNKPTMSEIFEYIRKNSNFDMMRKQLS